MRPVSICSLTCSYHGQWQGSKKDEAAALSHTGRAGGKRQKKKILLGCYYYMQTKVSVKPKIFISRPKTETKRGGIVGRLRREGEREWGFI